MNFSSWKIYTPPLCASLMGSTHSSESGWVAVQIISGVVISLAAAAFSKRDCEAKPRGHLGKD